MMEPLRPVPGERTPVLIVLSDSRMADSLKAELAAEAPEVEPLVLSRQLTDADLAGVAHALAWRLPPGLPQRLPALRWILATGAGVDKLLVPELPERVQVSRVVDPEQAVGMAQFTALMVLRHARGLAGYEALQRSREWRRQPVASVRHRVLVLGRGEIGRAVAGALQALGLGVTLWHTQAGPLAAMLGDADIVVNTLPLTPATEGLLDASAFAAMPRGAYLVNIARGGHVVEPDLIAAVRSGHLSGAALDVQQTEPMPPDDPLWAVPGITITPHIAAQPSWRTVARQFAQGLACLQRGEPPPNQVDRSRGY
jgi:phosphoglycerate dehydrogenase-like enzyme